MKITEKRLMEGEYNIPDMVVVSLPSNENEFKKYKETCLKDARNAKTRSHLGDKPSIYKGEVEYPSFEEGEIPTVVFLNPTSVYNYNCVVKRNTAANGLLKQLNNYARNICELTSVEIENKGWEVIKVISPDIYSEFTIPRSIGLSTRGGVYLQVNHPELTRKTEKLGYCSDDVCFVICVKNDYFINYLADYSNNLLFDRMNSKFRFIDISIDNYFTIDSHITNPYSEFISEEDYQARKDSLYKLAIGIGKSKNILDLQDQYNPGHLYKFTATNKNLNVGNGYNGSFFLLYIGKIGLFNYISSTYGKHSSLFCNNFIDMFDTGEFSNWTTDPEKIPILGNKTSEVWGELNIPVDVFIPLSRRGYRNSCKGRLIEKSLIQGRPLTETELYKHEEEIFRLATKIREYGDKKIDYNVISNLLPEGITDVTEQELGEIVDEELTPRFIVLPSVGLLSPKKKNILEESINKCDSKRTTYETEWKTSYRHFVDVRDTGKYITFNSPTQSIMKNLILEAEGKIKNYNYFTISENYERAYNNTYPGLRKNIGIDSYDLFTEEELGKMNKEILGNLKNNLSNLILTILLSYSTGYLSYRISNSTYWNKFSESPFQPEYDKVSGMLGEIEKAVPLVYNTCPVSERPDRVDMYKMYTFEPKTLKRNLLDAIINIITDGSNRELERRKVGIDYIIKKYKLTEKDFKKCEVYLK
jgi:hypothetical protein